MRKYNSKAGLEMVIPIAVIIGWLFYFSITEKDWTGIIVTIVLTAFFVYIFATTRYFIAGNMLIIKAGFLYSKYIEINSINQISAITDFFGAPATSVRRLLIQFNDSDSVAISPKDKLDFIKTITQINPAIVLKLNDE